MIIASRHSPQKTSLRRAHGISTPALSTKGGLLVPLIDSPLPSPVLPSIDPAHGKKRPGSGKRRAVRLLLWSLAIISLVRISSHLEIRVLVDYLNQSLIDDWVYRPSHVLPSDALPLLMTNAWGHQKWTISTPDGMGFPMSPTKTADLCLRCVMTSEQLSGGKNHPFDYLHPDRKYMDIAEAQSNSGSIMSKQLSSMDQEVSAICETSLTFVMQSEDAGLGNTLMTLWLSYGLAQVQGRSFFIDDTHWAYGQFSTFFQLPPKPTCRLPPPSHRVPCPLQARHLVVSSANSKWIFGESFKKRFVNSRATTAEQQKTIFDMARKGYEALFHLVGDDASVFEHRIREMNRTIRNKGGLEIGVHVRRGDMHPLEAQYRDSYIPLEKYTSRAERLLQDHLLQATSDNALRESMQIYSRVILASDDPDMYNASELQGAEKAQNYISLASKSILDAAAEVDNRLPDENIGWEGGFYKDLFWSLGESDSYALENSPLPSSRELKASRMTSLARSAYETRFRPSKESLGLRELIARAYLLDLAILGQSDRVICGIGSASCRLLAVMMGWERAIMEKGWQNVDGRWHWTYETPT